MTVATTPNASASFPGFARSASAATRTALRLAKTRFLRERAAPLGVQEAVARSWERSQALGLRPQDKTLFRASASTVEARVIGERARRLIDAVTPEVERVAAALTHSKTIVFCTDAAGTIVHSLCHDATAPRELREPLRLGRVVSEAEFGTTAPGCVLAEQVPVTVMGEEHFLSEVTRFACAAAPIFQFDGTLAGVLDITGFDVIFDAVTADLVHIAARASEHRLFAAAAPGVHVRLHHDPRFLHTPLAGLLALGEDGRVVGACSAARQTLRLGAREGQLHELLDVDHDTLRRQLHGGRAVPLRTQHGGTIYASLEPRGDRIALEDVEPLLARARGDAAASAPRDVAEEPAAHAGGVLERVTASIVRRTLAEHGGNVSAAARALGISRGTLYKKARLRT